MGDYAQDVLSVGRQQQDATAVATGIDSPPVDAPAADGPYSDTIRLMNAGRAQAAKGAALDAMGSNPDAAGKAQALAPQVDAPADAVEADLATYQAQDEFQKNAAIIDQNPVLADWLAANPQSARVARDDFDKLDAVSKTAKALSSGFTGAFVANQRGRLGFDVMTGIGNTAQNEAQAGQLEARMKASPALAGVYGKLQSLGSFTGGLLDNFFHALPAAAGGAAVGGVAGAAAAGAGAVPGAIGGALAGGGIGFKVDMALTQAGNTYLDLGNVKGLNGEAIDEHARQGAAVIAGLGTYALAGIGGDVAQKTAADTYGALLSDAIKESVTQPTIARAMTRFSGQLAKAGLEGAALNTAMQGTAIFAEEYAKQVSAGDFATVFNDPVERQQMVDRLTTAALDGALLFPVLKLPFAAGSLVGDTLRARQAGDDMAVFGQLEQGAVDSKTRGRSLDAFRSFLGQQTDGSPVENLYIPGARLRELYQSMKVDPRDGDPLLGGFVHDIADQLAETDRTGGDVVIPTADYVTHLAGTPLSEQLRADIRLHPDAWTMREAEEFSQGRGDFLAQNAVGMQIEAQHEIDAAEPTRQVFGDMFSKLRAAGYTNDTARQYAQLLAARYQTRAERLGGDEDAFALYQKQGVDVKRTLPSSLEHVPVDDSDMVINALRDGKKLPSDRQLYGPSLTEFLKESGGVHDAGGELHGMDADKVMKGLIRAPKLGEDTAEHGVDAMTLRAYEAGYFPEFAERPTPDDLIEAVREELGGTKRYAGSADEKAAGFKEAVDDLDQFTTERGIDVKARSNAYIKKALRDYQAQGVEGRDLGQGERGKITIAAGRHLISLFRDADLSTFLHESGHLFLEELIADAKASPELAADLDAVRKFAGLEEGAAITDAAHEKFAQGFEQYLLEGRAPATALGAAFAKFKAWLSRIYAATVGAMAPINDELRGVFDRLVASDQEIAHARQVEGMNPLFSSADDAGMTKAEFAAYTKGVNQARATAQGKLLKKAMETVRAQRTKQWQEEEAGVRAQVDERVRARPDLKAQYWLRTGRMLDDPDATPAVARARLSRADLKEMYGNDEAAGLLPRNTYANKGGMHPDEAADLFGYRSGDALVKSLMSLEATRKQAADATGKPLDGARYLRHLVDGETQAVMRERWGDALSDGSIEEEAMSAVHNAAQEDVMVTELRALARKAGVEAPLNRDEIASWVKSSVADMKLDKGTSPAAFARGEAKASREVERALLKGDYKAAFEARQRQLVNHLLARETGDMAELRAEGEKLFARYAKAVSLAGMDQPYLDRIHEVLTRMGFELKRDSGDLSRGLAGRSLADFVAQRETDGREFVVPSFLLDPTWRKTPADMTVDEFLGVKDAIQSLASNGRDEKMVTLEGARVELASLVNEAVEKLATMKQRDIPRDINPGTAGGARGVLERAGTLARAVDAGLMKQEQIFDWLDGRDPGGVFNRVVFRRLKEAQHRENDLMALVTGRLKALDGLMPKDWAKGLDARAEYPELRARETGEAYIFRKKDILAIALNTGNMSNFQKLTKGYGWSPGAVQAVLDRVMGKADWDFVQGVWDTFEMLWPDIDSMTRRVTGVGPEKVEATPFSNAHGSYRGGYFPVIYDPLKSQTAAMHAERGAVSLMENGYFRATTPKGHTISRVDDFSRPLRLQLDVIPWKLGQTVHDLAFREAIMDADKFLSAKDIRRAVDGVLGPEYTKQFRRWLQGIANDRNIDDKGLQGLDAFVRRLRVNATMVGIGFRVTTMLKHGMTALSNSVGEVGGKWMLQGAREVYGDPALWKAKYDYALERSGELRHRMNQIDRDVRDSLRTLQGESSWIADAERYGHYGVATLDMGSAVPTWYGAYRHALSDGAQDADAVYMADKAVRNAHGGQGVTDLAAIQRGGEIAKLFTMFYGFFNHIYNRQRDTIRIGSEGRQKLAQGDYAGARRDFGVVLARSFYYLAVPALIEAAVSEGGPDENKGESWLGWAARAVAGEIPAGIPVLRDIAKFSLGLASGKGNVSYEMSPVGRAVETAGRTVFQDLPKLFGWSDKKPSQRWLQHAIETAGYVFGLPSGQIGGTAQYLWDLSGGEEQPQGVGDFMSGLMYGPRPKKK